ncbi:MAG: tRNA (N6-threonylcarbamoyladenosine(37)-N6)-methyltransferase TrmO [Bacteroidales bacterium]|nr:tRNA (N6-threonylcarbamoyladenosine(37)-N6)-methyltransferase TrmO [Bacteroidales bacterium]
MKQIAHIETPFKGKFGVPRQAGLVDYEARVVFEDDYRVAEAVRGLESFDYVWLIWRFHMAEREGWSPTVRPPRLGGNRRVGVFASRSPFRPNAIGLSSVRLVRVEQDPRLGPVLYVEGADLVDGTPILDIKPYIAYADAHPEARSGFAPERPTRLQVVDEEGWLLSLPEADRRALIQCLSQDPRPHYQHDATRVYAMPYDRWEVRFRVENERVEVVEVTSPGC